MMIAIVKFQQKTVELNKLWDTVNYILVFLRTSGLNSAYQPYTNDILFHKMLFYALMKLSRDSFKSRKQFH